ncbi:MAG: hypothetical protein LUI08_02435 [Prevotella sp.]|nr:hypothetical protein [Prevotella sp.]
MKKFLFTAVVALVGAACYADNYGFTTLTQGPNTQMMYAIGISPDGHYVTCSYIVSALYDTQTEDIYNIDDYECEFNAVTNSGLMLGYYGDDVYAYNPLDSTATLTYGTGGNKNYAIARGATTDESIIVGDAVFDYFDVHAFYKKSSDTELTLLHEPTEQEIGCAIQGTVALNVSDDGKYICGYAIDEEAHQGGLLWVLNDATGEYDLEVLCKDIFPNKYYWYSPTAMSHNGKYIAFTIQENDGEYGGSHYLGLYDVESREMIATATTSAGTACTSTRIADDGTILGHTGDPDADDRAALIWFPGEEKVQYMRDVYPAVTEFETYDNEEGAWNYPTDITPDGRYICGMALHAYEDTDEDSARRIGWVFDTQEYAATGIQEISAATDDSHAAPEYYSIDGKRLNAPQKGLNIVKTGTKATKIVVE